MSAFRILWTITVGLASQVGPLPAQTFPTGDPVLRRIWAQATDSSRAYALAQALIDSIGPRLTGSPAHRAANQWLVSRYHDWGIAARNEQYGTWLGWERGPTHVDLVRPRVRTLEATMLAWSPGTNGPVEGGVVVIPDGADAAAFAAWLPAARGKFVLISMPESFCRPPESWKTYAGPDAFTAAERARALSVEAWSGRVQRTGLTIRDLPRRLEQAGVAGVLTSTWSQGWGVTRIFGARTDRVPSLDLSCEDYGLLYRLAQGHQGPWLRVDARAKADSAVPVFNTIAEIRGVERPGEYVMLSSHLDSWDGGSGATDTGAGTIALMEAMRILAKVYPNPKRTILAGHWGGEEQGLNGSRAFAADHPEIVQGLQVLLNFDIGTGKINDLSAQGMTKAGEHFASWLSRIPAELSGPIKLTLPGTPHSGGTDHASFLCYGAPAFRFGEVSWDYFTYTWHTNRDTFDKIIVDELKPNAALVAMLAYLAAEDPDRVPRDQLTDFPVDPQTGTRGAWPQCQPPIRRWEDRR